MTIVVPEPPTETVKALRRGLRVLSRLAASAVPRERVMIGRALPLYRATGTDGEAADPVPLGWRFVIVARHALLWADLAERELVAIDTGAPVAALLAAATSLERAGAAGEARVLIVPTGGDGAVWIHGDSDRLWAFGPALGDAECDAGTLHAVWAQRAAAAGRASMLE